MQKVREFPTFGILNKKIQKLGFSETKFQENLPEDPLVLLLNFWHPAFLSKRLKKLFPAMSFPLTINVDTQSVTSDLPSSVSSSVNSFVYQGLNQESLKKQLEELTVCISCHLDYISRLGCNKEFTQSKKITKFRWVNWLN